MVNNREPDTSVACTDVEFSVRCCAELAPNCKYVSSGCCDTVSDRVSLNRGDVHFTEGIGGDNFGEKERKRCSCLCHLQRSSSRNCPHISKSRNNIVVDESARTQYCTVGVYTQQELRHDVAGNVSSHPEKTQNTESQRQYTGSRNRLKDNDLPNLGERNNVSKSSKSKSPVFKSWRTRLATKKTMCRIVCQCFLVIVLCLSGTVLMTKHNYESLQGNILHKSPSAGLNMGLSETQEPVLIVKDMPFRSVPLEVLEKRVETATSAADMLKLFFHDQNLSDNAVNSIMWMKTHRHLYGSKEKIHQQRNQNFVGDAEEDLAKYREEAFNHIKSVSSFAACSEPKPEVIQIEEAQRLSFKYYMPSCTVLHRCSEHTGCCPKGYRCRPKKKNGIEIVTRPFIVFKVSVDDTVIPHEENMVEEKHLINHTACECQKININSNCHKKCPEQFTRHRPGDNCVCVCRHNNKKCRHMYRGLHALSERDLECIKSGECLQPSCHTGEFKIQTGYCPSFRHKHHQKHHRHKG